jgi:hypothetical protein
MITWSVARQRVGKHVSATADTHATVNDIAGNGVFFVVRAGII